MANAQTKYQEKVGAAQNAQIEQNAQAARDNFLNVMYGEQITADQEADAAGRQGAQQAREAARARATAQAAAGEAGVAGLSLDALIADYKSQEAAFTESIAFDLESSGRQREARGEAARLEAEGRAKAVQPYIAAPVQHPSLLGEALKVNWNPTITAAQNMNTRQKGKK